MSSPSGWLANALAINRTVGIVLLSVLLFGMGEQLWSPFLPVYLKVKSKPLAEEAIAEGTVPGETLALIGIYALALHLFEAFCYSSGGKITGRLGDRGSLILFSILTISGYALFLLVPTSWGAVLAALLILGWEPLSMPVTFTTVGATVTQQKRGLAFALQSIQKRLPKMIGPVTASVILGAMARRLGEAEGYAAGMRILVGIALGLGVAMLAVQWKYLPHREPDDQRLPWRTLFAQYPPILKKLLLAEVFTRWCDWLVREFVVLYLLFVRGVAIETVGLLALLQHTVALLTYLPVGRLTETVGLMPFVGLTFVFFALFPLTLTLVPNEWLPLAFVVYGLREIGEPARKALITTSIPKEIRARGVGLYWGLRSVTIAWAGLAGAALWWFFGPETLFFAAFAFGAAGAAVYYGLVSRATTEPNTPPV